MTTHKMLRWHTNRILKELAALRQLPLEPGIHRDIRTLRAMVETWPTRSTQRRTPIPKAKRMRLHLERAEQLRALAGDLQTNEINEDITNALYNLEEVCDRSVKQLKGLADD